MGESVCRSDHLGVGGLIGLWVQDGGWVRAEPGAVADCSVGGKAPLNAFQIAFEGRLTPSNN